MPFCKAHKYKQNGITLLGLIHKVKFSCPPIWISCITFKAPVEFLLGKTCFHGTWLTSWKITDVDMGFVCLRSKKKKRTLKDESGLKSSPPLIPPHWLSVLSEIWIVQVLILGKYIPGDEQTLLPFLSSMEGSPGESTYGVGGQLWENLKNARGKAMKGGSS